ncbi:MAG: S8 family serine peptidase, partial [Candidatus Aenigmatarchaeota archaeon]
MKKLSFFLIILLIIILCSNLSQAVATQNSKANYVPDELLIRFKPGTKPTKEKQLLEENGLTVKEEIEKIKVKLVKVAPEALETIEKKLSKNPNIDFVEKNMILEPAIEPNDQYYWKQWHLKNINAEYAWNVSFGSENVKIVICDSGVDENHPDLKDKLILPGWNFYDNNDNVTDVFGHGTMVIGTAAASTNNFIGVAAIAWKPKVIPVRVTDTKGYAYYSTLSKCLIYAADKGAKAASMSFLIFNGSSLTSAAKYLMDKGGLAFAAGGNTGKYENYTDNPYIVSVAATLYDNRATFSSYGPYIDLSAP